MSASRDPRQAGRSAGPVDETLVRRHLRIGWWSVAVFGLLGLVLETLHGFKIGFYLDVSNDTRRLMWTLAHAHGTLLGLVHLGFAFTLRQISAEDRNLRTASAALMGASAFLPIGFFLGGVRFYAGDPGVGVALVPVGAVLAIYTAVVAVRRVGRDV